MKMHISEETPKFYITMGYLYALFDYLKSKNIPVERILNLACLTIEDIEDRDRVFNVELLDLSMEKAAEITEDPLLGFHAGQQMSASHLGIIGHLILCCNTPEELLQLLIRYGKLVGNGIEMHYEDHGDLYCLRQELVRGEETYSRQADLYNLTGWMTVCRWMGGADLAPSGIEFPHSEETDYGPVRKFMGCDIKFNAPTTNITLSKEFLETVFLLGDTGIRPMVEAEARKRLEILSRQTQGENSLVASVRQLISNQLAMGVPELRDIAADLGMSGRRLQYDLKSSGISFKAIVDDVRKGLAYRHLHDSSMSLIDTALVLGFSDQSTFQRAFKRWYGMPPGEYRKKCVQA